MRSGLTFSLGKEYRPLAISPLNARRCWEVEFQSALRDIAGETYPQADFNLEGSNPYVSFSKVNKIGIEVLNGSKPFDKRKPPVSEVARVQEEIELIHALANDGGIPSDRREFFRNFQLPDPRFMPECWRTTGLFRRRLHIIWGLARSGQDITFLPTSASSTKWDDGNNRTSLREVLGMTGAPLPGLGSANRDTPEGGVSSGKRVLGSDRADVRADLKNVCQVNEGLVNDVQGASKSWWRGYRECGGRGGRIVSRLLRWGAVFLLAILLAYFLKGCVKGCSSGMVHGLDTGTSSMMPGQRQPDDASAPSDMGKNFGGPQASGGGGAGGGASGGGASGPASALDGSAPPVSSGDSPASDRPNPVSSLESAKALACRFRVDDPKELPGTSPDVARVEFSVSPIDDFHGGRYVVSDWKVNDEIKQPGESATYTPADGLRYDKTYTITAVVTVDGNPQRVEPYQWNTVDNPTWQILEIGRDATGDKRQYKLICCNSSSIRPVVKEWRVKFRAGGNRALKELDFDVEQKSIEQDKLEVDWGIGRYKGAYFLELAAEIHYPLRNREMTAAHVEIFPFSHDSSADGLTKAKYEMVIPKVYFCLARLQDGSLANGTAFAISEKLLLTNYHVAVGGIPESYSNSGNYQVVGPVTLTNVKGKTYYAKVDRSDRGRDIAILRLCDRSGGEVDDVLPGYLHLSDDKLVENIADKSGRHVFAIGYPRGTVCMGPPAFTDGKAEKVFKRNYSYNGKKESYETILNYTSVSCGYSGGPLIDYQTESVLGVNFGGLNEIVEGHKAGSFATTATEVRRVFSDPRK